VFLAGQAPLHPPTIYRVIGDRIAEATVRVLNKAKETGTTPRKAAEQEAMKFLEANREVCGFRAPETG
jgi:hypothetical protein